MPDTIVTQTPDEVTKDRPKVDGKRFIALLRSGVPAHEAEEVVMTEAVTAATRERLLSHLSGLGDKVDEQDVEQALRVIAAGVKSAGLDRLGVATLRARIIKELEKRDIRGPAAMADIALAPAVERGGPRDVLDDGEGDADEEKFTQAQWLIEYGQLHADLWRTPEGEGFITYHIDGHREHAPIRSRATRDWLRLAHHREFNKPPGSQALQDAIDTLGAIAHFDGDEHPVFIRVGHHRGAVYIDLGDEDWQAIEVTAEGWRVVFEPPVRFRRTRGMLPLPVPVAGGSLDELWTLFPRLEAGDRVLAASWLVGALSPRGPYPILILHGEQGTGKSTAGRMLRGLIDPNTAALRSVPREERDLLIAARNAWVLAFDNLSGTPIWLSDGLCRLSTGGGWATRELYTDTDEVLIEAQRPILLNGIDEIATRDDLRDRSIILQLPTLDDAERLEEAELWAVYERLRPRVLGALLDAVSMALKRWDEVKLPTRPRMADFARWIAAAEPALPWAEGDHLTIYAGNRQDAAAVSLESNPVAQALLAAAGLDAAEESKRNEPWTWEGTATDLLRLVNQQVDEQTQRRKEWPKTPRALSSRIRRAAPLLRQAGLDVDLDRREGRDRRRVIALQKRTEKDRPHRPHRPQVNSDAGFPADGMRTQNENAGDTVRVPSAPESPSGAGWTDADAKDGIERTFSKSDNDGREVFDI